MLVHVVRWSASVALVISLGCGAPSDAAGPLEAPDALGAANAALLDVRYCRPIAALSARVIDACGCAPDDVAAGMVSDDELFGSCTYHLLPRIPDDRALSVDEDALGRCLEILEGALSGCTSARLPEECELDRIVGPLPGTLALSRPEGSPCREANGDEGFDADFVCARGLECDDTCRPEVDCEPPGCGIERCRNPLGLPGAFP